eukprot:c16226_g1_i1.p2 GENE.c16226_g1_i1~~c16226_g1_i1.p2  ORF type:complete len:125 (-),score=18.17 c16226_g1_i1:157-531(-)
MKPIRDLVDVYHNCEDIALNFLVCSSTQRPPIWVDVPTTELVSHENTLSISSDSATHIRIRSECIREFSRILNVSLTPSRSKVSPIDRGLSSCLPRYGLISRRLPVVWLAGAMCILALYAKRYI